MLLGLVILIIALAAGACAVLSQAKFGKQPEGERLERIQASPNYKDGEFHNTVPTAMLAEGQSSLKIMIGGKGINTAGLGVCLNALSVGRGQIGVPLHVLYRGILNSTTVSNALDRLVRPVRAGAGAFTIGSESGVVLTFEYTPDDFDVLTSEGEPLCHTNHYLSPLFTGEDTLKSVLTDSYVRYDMLRRLTKRRDGPFTMDVIRRIFTDHVNYPDSICSHEDPQDPETARFCSVYGVAMDLDEKTLWVTDANPCEGRAHPFRLLP